MMSLIDHSGAADYVAASPSDRIEVVGSVHSVKFPPLCIRCGQYADTGLPLAKLFWHRSRGRPASYTLDRIDVPCCGGCLAEHQRAQQPVAPQVKRRMMWQWLGRSLPFFIPVGVITWMVSIIFIPQLLEVLADAERVWAEVLLWGGIAGFFAILGLSFLWLILREGRMLHDGSVVRSGTYVNLERGPLFSRMIVPATHTAALTALDFSGNRADLFDRQRHLYYFTNSAVAAEFAQLNAARLWDPEAPTALLAHYLRMGLYIGLGVLLLLGLLNRVIDW